MLLPSGWDYWIAYQPQHNSDEICPALIESPNLAFAITSTRPLTAMLHEVAALLDAYRKSLSPT